MENLGSPSILGRAKIWPEQRRRINATIYSPSRENQILQLSLLHLPECALQYISNLQEEMLGKNN